MGNGITERQGYTRDPISDVGTQDFEVSFVRPREGLTMGGR